MKRLRDILLESTPQTGREAVHHVSPHDIEDFHPLSHFGTYKAARTVGSYTHRDEAAKEDWKNSPKYRDRFHYKARLINSGKTHKMSDGSMDHTPDRVIKYLHQDGVFSKTEADHHVSELRALASKHQDDSSLEAKTYAANAIRSKGIHTLEYVNDLEDPGKKSYAITHPNQVHVIKKTKVSIRSNQANEKEHPVPAMKSNSDIINHGS